MPNQSREAADRQLISGFLTTLTSTAALLVTVSAGLYAFTVKLNGFPNVMILYSSAAYLLAVIFGIVALGGLVSAVHYGDRAFDNWFIQIPAILQWIFFIAGSVITTWMLYLLVNAA